MDVALNQMLALGDSVANFFEAAEFQNFFPILETARGK
jgi:hypothetical protein